MPLSRKTKHPFAHLHIFPARSRFCRYAFDLERGARQLGCLGLDRGINAHARQGPTYHPTGEPEELYSQSASDVRTHAETGT